MKKLVLLLVVFSLSTLIYSQAYGQILYAEGEFFSIVDSLGNRAVYEPYYDDVVGLQLQLGDTILTESETYLEIGFSNGSSIIKISENTTFRIDALTNDGGALLNVAYGRIRARVDRLTGEQDFWISGYDTVAGIRGTDFGYDLFFDPEQENGAKTTTVYCFEGSVEVIQELEDPSESSSDDKRIESKDPIIIEANEMVVVQSGTPDQALVKEPLSLELDSFWQERDFVETAEAMPQSSPMTTDVELPDVELPQSNEDYTFPEGLTDDLQIRRQRALVGGGVSITVGLAMVTAGIINYALDPDNSQQHMYVYSAVGGTFILSGIGMSLYSVSLGSP